MRAHGAQQQHAGGQVASTAPERPFSLRQSKALENAARASSTTDPRKQGQAAGSCQSLVAVLPCEAAERRRQRHRQCICTKPAAPVKKLISWQQANRLYQPTIVKSRRGFTGKASKRNEPFSGETPPGDVEGNRDHEQADAEMQLRFRMIGTVRQVVGTQVSRWQVGWIHHNLSCPPRFHHPDGVPAVDPDQLVAQYHLDHHQGTEQRAAQEGRGSLAGPRLPDHIRQPVSTERHAG